MLDSRQEARHLFGYLSQTNAIHRHLFVSGIYFQEKHYLFSAAVSL
jgi:hypothetical protein